MRVSEASGFLTAQLVGVGANRARVEKPGHTSTGNASFVRVAGSHIHLTPRVIEITWLPSIQNPLPGRQDHST
jgi:hypothetical protein